MPTDKTDTTPRWKCRTCGESIYLVHIVDTAQLRWLHNQPALDDDHDGKI